MIAIDRRSMLVAAGILAVVIGLVATFPARLALAWFAPPEVQSWGVAGTVWRGRAADVVVQEHSLGALSWQARPTRMLLLHPSWDLELRRPDGFATGRVELSLTGNRQTITDLEVKVALETLPPAIVQNGVAGQVQISLQRLEFDQGWPVAISGRAAVGALVLPDVIVAIGPFEFRFPERSGPPLAEIRSVGGPLEVDGSVELPARGKWIFDVELAPGENPPRQVVEGLPLIAEDLGNGRWRMVRSGEL